ncbi:MAG: sigma-70 family RNA polymerase sigma factor, partial [Bacteroidales bacterium]|nr:sigma-70 family RNA polymerase sigma factor [Bacteroidales bacterium]
SKSITKRDSASFEKYLQDIAKVDLITPEEEIELAQKIKKGNQQALEKLVNANLRFVVSVAKHYQHRGLSLQDLVNEGNLGLIKAAKMFDETRGFKFISYAVWWIRQTILLAIAEQSRIVRLPVNKIGTINRINNAKARFEQENDRIPTETELSEILGIPEHKLKNNIRNSSKHISIDAPVGNEEDKSMVNFMEDEQSPAPEKPLLKQSLNKEILRVLETLPDKERKVVKHYFGINEKPMTLIEIGRMMDLSRERVRQLRDKGLRDLRKPSKKKLLIEYLAQ